MNNEALVTENLDLPAGLARTVFRLFPAAVEVEDLVGAGQVALVEAAQRYEPARGDFRAYASVRVRGAMLDAVRSSNVVGRRAYAKGVRVSVRSLGAPIKEDGEGTLEEVIPDPRPSVEEIVEQRAQLAEILALPDREREVVLRAASGEQQAEIADSLSVSPSRVGQITARATERLGADGPEGTALTPAELDVLQGAAQGETVEETAQRTGRAVETIKSQRKSAMRRLNARSITHAVFLAYNEIAAWKSARRRVPRRRLFGGVRGRGLARGWRSGRTAGPDAGP
jgi:RNA polymerase sigma factor (sigma-70 family)